MSDREALRRIHAECQAADSSTQQHEFVRHLMTISSIATVALNEDEILQKSVISDQQINAMAQYLYEGINLSADVRLVMDMTSKATLVKVLRQVLIRAGVIGDDRWSIAYMHEGCAQCEQCADLAVESAKRRYLVSDQYTVMIPSGDGRPTIGHRAVVERVL